MSRSAVRDGVFQEVWPSGAKPEISVLMPVYNQEPYVGAAVSSILSQEGVVAEIIVSDDGSDDGTFEEVLRVIAGCVEQGGCAHAVVVRRGAHRLWRDHLPLLIENARCDLVCQAHGDDLSAPTRCRDLVAAFQADPLISLVASEAFWFTDPRDGIPPGATTGNRPTLRAFTQSEVLDGHEWLIGAMLAWRRSALEGFPRLDTAYAATSHDRILAFRASLAGKVMLLQAPLVKRRMHPLQASQRIFHDAGKDSRFGWSLLRLTALSAMSRDVLKAAEMSLIDQRDMDDLEKQIRERQGVFQAAMKVNPTDCF